MVCLIPGWETRWHARLRWYLRRRGHRCIDRGHSLDWRQRCPRRFAWRSRACRSRRQSVICSFRRDTCRLRLSLSISSKSEHCRVRANRCGWLGCRDLDRVLLCCSRFWRRSFFHFFLAFILRRHGFIMRESDLCSICPFDRFRCPIILVVINVGPFSLGATSVSLDSRRHVNAVLLFQFFICQMLWWCWLGSYVNRPGQSRFSTSHCNRTYVGFYSKLDSDPGPCLRVWHHLGQSSRMSRAYQLWSLQRGEVVK